MYQKKKGSYSDLVPTCEGTEYQSPTSLYSDDKNKLHRYRAQIIIYSQPFTHSYASFLLFIQRSCLSIFMVLDFSISYQKQKDWLSEINIIWKIRIIFSIKIRKFFCFHWNHGVLFCFFFWNLLIHLNLFRLLTQKKTVQINFCWNTYKQRNIKNIFLNNFFS